MGGAPRPPAYPLLPPPLPLPLPLPPLHTATAADPATVSTLPVGPRGGQANVSTEHRATHS